jgi:predicted nucleotidyltransferase
MRGAKQKKGSDIDLLVTLEEPLGLAFLDLKYYLEEVLDLQVDLVTVNALKPELQEDILQEATYL